MTAKFSQFVSFYDDKRYGSPLEKGIDNSDEPKLSKEKQRKIVALCGKLESFIKNGQMNDEAASVIELSKLLRGDDDGIMCAYSLITNVCNCQKFLSSVTAQLRYALLLERACVAETFYCADEVVSCDVGHSVVFSLYDKAKEYEPENCKGQIDGRTAALRQRITDTKETAKKTQDIVREKRKRDKEDYDTWNQSMKTKDKKQSYAKQVN